MHYTALLRLHIKCQNSAHPFGGRLGTHIQQSMPQSPLHNGDTPSLREGVHLLQLAFQLESQMSQTYGFKLWFQRGTEQSFKLYPVIVLLQTALNHLLFQGVVVPATVEDLFKGFKPESQYQHLMGNILPVLKSLIGVSSCSQVLNGIRKVSYQISETRGILGISTHSRCHSP